MSDTLTILLFTLTPVVLAPLVMNWIAGRIEAKVEESRTWTKVDATVTHSKARSTKNGSYADIRYTYSAHGEQRKAHRYCFGGFSGSRAAVRELVERYPVGAVIPVYYDPSNPGSATIERIAHIKGLRLIGWVISGTFLLLLLFVTLKRSGAIS